LIAGAGCIYPGKSLPSLQIVGIIDNGNCGNLLSKPIFPVLKVILVIFGLGKIDGFIIVKHYPEGHQIRFKNPVRALMAVTAARNSSFWVVTVPYLAKICFLSV